MFSHKLSIFISHPSNLFTNCQPYGDGLIAFEFIYRLAQRGHTLHVATPAMSIQGTLPGNIKIYPADVWTNFSTLNPLEYAIRVRKIYNQVRKEHKVDIIHQLNPVSRGLSFFLLGTGLPLVLGPFWVSWPSEAEAPLFKTSMLGSISSAATVPLLNLFFAIQQKKASALLVSTPAALVELYDQESNLHKIHTLTPGVDTTFFSPESIEYAEAKKDSSILFLANLEQRKGIFTLLDAFEKVVEVLPFCQLIIAGGGAALTKVEQRISTMSCRSQISLLGRVERNQVPELMRQCTVFCLPSYGEPFGMSALEAMACGKPVVVTDAGGLAYLVSEQGGRKVPPRDVNALANALVEIVSSPELQIKMANYNRQVVEEQYSWNHVIERLESIYYDLLLHKSQ